MTKRRARNRLWLILLVVVASAWTVIAAAEEEEDDVTVAAAAKVVASIEIDLPSLGNAEAVDEKDECAAWAAAGECDKNPGFMRKSCAASCRQYRPKKTAVVYEGEDAAMGAIRFAEEYSSLEDKILSTNVILEVASNLQQELDSQKVTLPLELTHCSSSGNKQRPCSAGKLWKRAEELRKSDMNDAAGADLIRALSKSGLEVDFVDKCERSLQWTLTSLRKQREREQREALEEQKLEEKRQQERLAMEEAEQRKQEYEANFFKFGKQLQESLESSSSQATLHADGTVDVEDLTSRVKQTFIQSGPQGGNWSETLQLIKKIPMSDKTVDILLIEARCHEMQGNHKSALSAAGRLVQKAASHEPWTNDSPRMMAATLGANAAMQLGLSENAISFYQTVLKFDPEQERARTQYRGLKKVVKLLGKAEEQIQKGYNVAASGHVDDCLSAMRGLDVDSPLFRSKIQLKQCTILSAMDKHEEALENCDIAVELRLGHDSVSATSRKEAHLVRAEALLLDMDYDEAVQDFRAAVDLVPEDDNTGERRELQHKLQSAIQQQELWKGGQKDYRYNENTGFPDGRPPQRDHAKILQLPIDLEERTKDIKCAWLKKQFKALVKKYHPDKYKGNKKRAARKFAEVKDAKEIMSKAWEC